MNLPETRFDDAAKFLEHLDLSAPHWARKGKPHSLVFRGVEDANYDLTPVAWREGSAESPLLSRVKVDLEQHKSAVWLRVLDDGYFPGLWRFDYEKRRRLRVESCKDRILHHLVSFGAELECIHRFAALSDELGLPAPLEDLVSGEEFLFDNQPLRKNEGMALCGGPEVEIPMTACIAQHHGVPTRLLDWTRDPMVAAYFALPRMEESRGRDVAVWVLDVRKARTLGLPNGKSTVRMIDITLPRHMSPFVHGQSGLFTVLDHADSFFVSEERWPRMEEVCGEALEKLVLAPSQTGTLRELLWRKRVSKPHLMPTRDNVARSLLEEYGWGLR